MKNQTEYNTNLPRRFTSRRRRFRPLLIILSVIALCLLTAFLYYQLSSSTFDPLRSILGSYRNYVEIEGSITDGVYTSPLKNFSCRFPSLATAPAGKVLQDGILSDGGAVVFTDDFGNLLRVDYYAVEKSHAQTLADPEQKKSYFEDVLSNLVQKSFPPSAGNTGISHQEFLDSENEVILYGVIDTGSNFTVPLVGVFVLNTSNFIYTLMNNSGNIEDLKQGLLDFYHTCEFN